MGTAKQAIGPNQEKWLQALESGEYRQYRGGGIGEFRHGEECNCCLGVYGRISDQERRVCADHSVDYGGEGGYASDETIRGLALHNHMGQLINTDFATSLAEANDSRGKTFAEIAAFCRANPEAVFVEPR